MSGETSIKAYENAKAAQSTAENARGETPSEMRKKAELYDKAAEEFRAAGQFKDAVETAKECAAAAKIWREKAIVFKRAHSNLHGGHVYRGDNPIARVMSNAMLKKKFFTRIAAGVLIVIVTLILQHFAVRLVETMIISGKYDRVYENAVAYAANMTTLENAVNTVARENKVDADTARAQIQVYMDLRNGTVIAEDTDPLLVDKLVYYIIMTEDDATADNAMNSLRMRIAESTERGLDAKGFEGINTRMTHILEKERTPKK